MPAGRGNAMIREKRSVGFMSAYAWMDFMRSVDFSYGCNIHGNIAAVLAGTPCMVIERDRRVSELARFIGIPMITLQDIRAGMGILELYERADFGGIAKKHAEGFERFVNLLNVNGLHHIYESEIGEAPYDRLIRRISPEPFYPRGIAEILKDPWTAPVYRAAGNVLMEKLRRRLKIGL